MTKIGLSWGVEIELDDRDGKSEFFSARRVVLGEDGVHLQLHDGYKVSFPIGSVRKVLAMRSTHRSDYTDEDFSSDEIY